jgi:hypothetical protein
MIFAPLRSLQFSVRQNFLGKLKLRPGLPNARVSRAESDFYRLILKTALPEGGNDIDLLVDVGCRNWSYARALAEFFPSADLLGIELDGGRRYWNLHRRVDQAEAFAREASSGRKIHALCADFMDVDQKTAGTSPELVLAISFFYPFVSVDPCLSWGLPARYSSFSPLLTHAKRLMLQSAPGSVLVSCHQGEWESEIAARCYAGAGFHVTRQTVARERFEDLWPSRADAHVFTASLARRDIRLSGPY